MAQAYSSRAYWQTIWSQFRQKKTGLFGLFILSCFIFIAIYAPFFASSKPIALVYDGRWYFPLFRYLFYSGFYTKNLDLFFNLLIFTAPLFLMMFYFFGLKRAVLFSFALQGAFFSYLLIFPVKDPAADVLLGRSKQSMVASQTGANPSWSFDLEHMNDYAKLNQVLRYRLRKEHHEKLKKMLHTDDASLSTLWQKDAENEERILSHSDNQAAMWYKERRAWLQQRNEKISFILMPLWRGFHWQDDAGGSQRQNSKASFSELTRINRKDLGAALIFGARVSLVVGIIAVALSLVIGIPVGALSGYYGGKTDILVSRLMEIWEAMPTFLMLLMVVAIAQNKSIFFVIAVIGIFSWTGFGRYIRAEFFKQRNLSYVEACKSLGLSDARIIFHHILPNAIPPILTLLPFAVMAAISSEAGLSFLGLGEEGSCSWGVLMDEGRSAFPGESYLLWPPAILLTVLLVAAALVGDALRDAFDPKMHA